MNELVSQKRDTIVIAGVDVGVRRSRYSHSHDPEFQNYYFVMKIEIFPTAPEVLLLFFFIVFGRTRHIYLKNLI